MKKLVAEKWIKALRSGKYKQTKDKLKGRVGYCCLGVLCDISGKGEFEKDDFGNNVFLDREDVLPEDVRYWAGLDSSDGQLYDKYDEPTDTLANLNDSGMSFREIAKIIRKNYKRL